MNLDFIAYPFGSLLKIIFNFIGNYGYSIIIFTIAVKLALLPLNIKQTESTKKMNEISPKIKAIQEKYKGDKEKLNEMLMGVYKEHNYNPASGCLPALVQMPIMIALYYVIQNPVKFVFHDAALYDGLAKSLWWITDLGKLETVASVIKVSGWGLPILAILSTITTYYQMKMIMPKGKNVDPTQKSMTTIMPLVFGWFTLQVPAGLALYWTVGNIFTIIQQYFMIRPVPGETKGGKK